MLIMDKDLSFEEFWKLLKVEGYEYGFDAAITAYTGYGLACKLQEKKIIGNVVKHLIKDQARMYIDNGFDAVGEQMLALIGEKYE